MGVLAAIRRVIVEALGGSLLGDRSGITQDPDLVGFRPISERARGKKTRDLTILSHVDMISIALFLYSQNALAEWLVDMPISLIVGQDIGYTVAVNDDLSDLSPEE